MKYLYIVEGISSTTNIPPNYDTVSDILDGFTQVFRFVDGSFEELNPTNSEDLGNWVKVEEELYADH